ncbi:MAG: carboxymuconolactone decarboxylase family protein [Spirochaetes bacterium]|nr:carboxymuconolactone decarboxylase family protein [Spirochaetota bacterium]
MKNKRRTFGITAALVTGLLLFAVLSLTNCTRIEAQANVPTPVGITGVGTQTAGRNILGEFAPQFAALNDDVLFGEVWAREAELAPRDRSMITVASLITSGSFEQLSFHLDFARQNGVTRAEIVEVVTHLAFYVGWPNAWSTFNRAIEIFTEADTAANEGEEITVEGQIGRQTAGRNVLGEFAPQFAALNDDVLFGEVWAREAELSPRDRSMITVTALITSGSFEQLAFHLNFARQNGITRTEIVEVITHLAFYVGWPNAWSTFNRAIEIFTE